MNQSGLLEYRDDAESNIQRQVKRKNFEEEVRNHLEALKGKQQYLTHLQKKNQAFMKSIELEKIKKAEYMRCVENIIPAEAQQCRDEDEMIKGKYAEVMQKMRIDNLSTQKMIDHHTEKLSNLKQSLSEAENEHIMLVQLEQEEGEKSKIVLEQKEMNLQKLQASFVEIASQEEQLRKQLDDGEMKEQSVNSNIQMIQNEIDFVARQNEIHRNDESKARNIILLKKQQILDAEKLDAEQAKEIFQLQQSLDAAEVSSADANKTNASLKQDYGECKSKVVKQFAELSKIIDNEAMPELTRESNELFLHNPEAMAKQCLQILQDKQFTKTQELVKLAENGRQLDVIIAKRKQEDLQAAAQLLYMRQQISNAQQQESILNQQSHEYMRLHLAIADLQKQLDARVASKNEAKHKILMEYNTKKEEALQAIQQRQNIHNPELAAELAMHNEEIESSERMISKLNAKLLSTESALTEYGKYKRKLVNALTKKEIIQKKVTFNNFDLERESSVNSSQMR